MKVNTKQSAIQHRSIVLRQIRARPRLFIASLIAAITLVATPQLLVLHVASRMLLAWNAGVGTYLLLAAVMIVRSSHEHLRWRARVQAELRAVVLVGVILATFACIAAIFAELSTVRDVHGVLKAEHIALTVTTVVLSWTFIHLMFALHYAHDYYLAHGHAGDGGLAFPGTSEPDYVDFLYFSAVIGTSGQTADVSFTSSSMRRWGLLHCVLSYAFNTTVLALAINIASGLI
jgi:uncharacterized membrane protein